MVPGMGMGPAFFDPGSLWGSWGWGEKVTPQLGRVQEGPILPAEFSESVPLLRP